MLLIIIKIDLNIYNFSPKWEKIADNNDPWRLSPGNAVKVEGVVAHAPGHGALFGRRRGLQQEQSKHRILVRVARWHFFQPKIQIWTNVVRPCYGRCICIIWPFGIFYSHLVYFTSI
jgi:hypothetical protein